MSSAVGVALYLYLLLTCSGPTWALLLATWMLGWCVRGLLWEIQTSALFFEAAEVEAEPYRWKTQGDPRPQQTHWQPPPTSTDFGGP